MNKEEYKGVCVFAEQREGTIQPIAFELLGKARELADVLGEEVLAVLCGQHLDEAARELMPLAPTVCFTWITPN